MYAEMAATARGRARRARSDLRDDAAKKPVGRVESAAALSTI
jgi:hypothetical protein